MMFDVINYGYIIHSISYKYSIKKYITQWTIPYVAVNRGQYRTCNSNWLYERLTLEYVYIYLSIDIWINMHIMDSDGRSVLHRVFIFHLIFYSSYTKYARLNTQFDLAVLFTKSFIRNVDMRIIHRHTMAAIAKIDDHVRNKKRSLGFLKTDNLLIDIHSLICY